MRRLLLVFAFTCSAFAARESAADIVFAYTAEVNPEPPVSGVFLTEPDAPTTGGDLRVEVAIGDLTRVNIFMIQTGSNESRLSDFGLVSAGVIADFNTDNGDVTTVIGKNLPLDPNQNNRALYRFVIGEDPSFDNTAGTVQMNGGIDLQDPRPEPGLGTGAAFIGFFEFETQRDGETTFTLRDVNPAASFSDNVLLDEDNTDLDAELFASAPVLTIATATAIPEPSAMLVLSAVAGLCTLRRRRRV